MHENVAINAFKTRNKPAMKLKFNKKQFKLKLNISILQLQCTDIILLAFRRNKISLSPQRSKISKGHFNVTQRKLKRHPSSLSSKSLKNKNPYNTVIVRLKTLLTPAIDTKRLIKRPSTSAGVLLRFCAEAAGCALKRPRVCADPIIKQIDATWAQVSSDKQWRFG